MNPYLAELYNTNGYAEKTAAIEEITHAFIKQCSAEGIDLSGASDDQIVDAALDWAEETSGGEDETEKIAQQFDYFGRIAAHAFEDERMKIAASDEFGQNIESPAPKRARKSVRGYSDEAKQQQAHAADLRKNRYDQKREFLGIRDAFDEEGRNRGRAHAKGQRLLTDGGVTGKARNFASKHKNKLLAGAAALGGLGLGHAALRKESANNNLIDKVLSGAKSRARIRSADAIHALRAENRSKNVDTALKALGGAGAGLAVGGAGTMAYNKLTEKKSHFELLEDAAIDRANAMIEAAAEGYDVTFDKVAAMDEDDLDRLITERAWELLSEEGYV